MNEEAELVRQIIEYPAEDTFRLQFADWLEENSDDRPDRRVRAEFIRLHIEYSRLKPRPTLTLLDPSDVRLLPEGSDRAHKPLRTVPFQYIFNTPHTLEVTCACRDPIEERQIYDLEFAFTGLGTEIRVTRVEGAICTKARPKLNLSSDGASTVWDVQFHVICTPCPVRKRREEQALRLMSWARQDANAISPAADPTLLDFSTDVTLGAKTLCVCLHRGFARRLIGPWDDFAKAADALLWSPLMGEEYPCPATAHPIEEVRITRFTDGPELGSQGAKYLGGTSTVMRWEFMGRPVETPRGDYEIQAGVRTWTQILTARWPGVKFVLPPPLPTPTTAVDSA